MNSDAPLSRGELIASLLSAQHADGAWGYQGAGSWTEPTAFALLALAANNSVNDNFQRGVRWLWRTQRSDGGWPPHATVDQSTWVTAPAVLALAAAGETARLASAVDWLQRQTGQESTLLARVRRILLGQRLEVGEGTEGWAWFPGAAAWVMPTALTILALERVNRRQPDADRQRRIDMGRAFLLARICRDGGWNHGSSRALGYATDSYPETTGVALLALHGAAGAQIARAVAKAEEQLPRCRSAQGQAWLSMGLLANGKKPPQIENCLMARDNVLDHALPALATAAESGWRIWEAS